MCLDVINQTWTPLYSLVNIFEIFLPQLLVYPNPADPLNPEAAQLMNRDKDKFAERAKEYVRLFASGSPAPSHQATEAPHETVVSDPFGEIEELDLDIDEL